VQTFRLAARRAIVADTYADSFRPEDVLEWYRRICDLSGLDYSADLPAYPRQAAERGYEQMDMARAGMLARKYGMDYIVVQADRHKGDLSGLHCLYNNPRFAVYRAPVHAEQ
jgi:hypothetical protein